MSIHVRETGKGRRYDVKLRDREGVMHTKTLRTKREAVDYEADQRAQLSAGTFIAPRASAITVEDLGARWLAAGTKRDSSRARDRSIVQTHLLPGLGPKRAIGTVTRADCQALVDRWAAVGLAPRTVIRVAAALRSMFQYALDAELLARNPAARLKLPQAQPVDRPTLTSDDLDRLAHALGPDQALLMWCGAILGLRWAEVAGLTTSSLDPVRNTISIRHQLDRHGNLVLPKTLASRRSLAAPPWLVADLAALPRQRGAAITDQAALVFVTPTRAGLSYVNWRTRVWQPATTTAGLTGLHFHDLRPLAATALVAAGVDLGTAVHRLGHTTPTMTLAVYARVAEDQDRAAADAVNHRLGPHH